MMFAKLRAWYCRQSSIYPVRWYWPIIRIFGGPERATVYMTRIMLGPKTPRIVVRGHVLWPGGRLYLHIFHREDLDRDPHDHPFPFWTLPLNQGYIESVYSSIHECFREQRVPRWRIGYRPAEHTHRVIATDIGRWPLVTLVWRGHTERRWGFWVHSEEQASWDTERFWTPFKDYVYGDGSNANVDGQDVTCPGTIPITTEGQLHG